MDHVPQNIKECTRIFKNKGSIYRQSLNSSLKYEAFQFEDIFTVEEKVKASGEIFDKWRITQGTLSVSRSFGDKMSKIVDGKMLGQLISEPEIFQIDTQNLDYLLLLSDGIHSVIENDTIFEIVSQTLKEARGKGKPIDEKVIKKAINNVLKISLIDGANDDITLIMICFKTLVE